MEIAGQYCAPIVGQNSLPTNTFYRYRHKSFAISNFYRFKMFLFSRLPDMIFTYLKKYTQRVVIDKTILASGTVFRAEVQPSRHLSPAS